MKRYIKLFLLAVVIAVPLAVGVTIYTHGVEFYTNSGKIRHMNPSIKKPLEKKVENANVLDLDGDGIELSAVNKTGSVFWDIDSDDFAEATGWIAGGDGLLAIDLNNDGYINAQSELFGNQEGTPNGFLTLAVYDTNNSGTITSADAQFSDLLVWIDTKVDAVSQAGELHTLSDLGITSINLNYSEVSYKVNGNEIKQESTFTINGQERSIVDAWFDYDNANTIYVGDYVLNIATLFLPTLRGYGTIPDLHIAMSKDQILLDMVRDFSVVDLPTLLSHEYDLQNKIEDILFRWADVDDVAGGSRGDSIDARRLEFLEEFTGDDWADNWGRSNPKPGAARVLNKAFDTIFAEMTSQLFVQTDAKKLFDSNAVYNPLKGIIKGDESAQRIHFFSNADDSFQGSDKNDWYIYNSGDGNGSIYDSDGVDRLLFGSGISLSDIRLEHSNLDLNIHIGASNIMLADQFSDTQKTYRIEEAVFADGSTLSLVDKLNDEDKEE